MVLTVFLLEVSLLRDQGKTGQRHRRKAVCSIYPSLAGMSSEGDLAGGTRGSGRSELQRSVTGHREIITEKSSRRI